MTKIRRCYLVRIDPDIQRLLGPEKRRQGHVRFQLFIKRPLLTDIQRRYRVRFDS